MREKNEKQLKSVESVHVGGKVEEQGLWGKEFVEKISFKPGVEERRSNGCVQPPPQTHPQIRFCNKNF